MSAHKYELMFIADPELDERGLKKLTEQYLETVTKEGGAVENIDMWDPLESTCRHASLSIL